MVGYIVADGKSVILYVHYSYDSYAGEYALYSCNDMMYMATSAYTIVPFRRSDRVNLRPVIERGKGKKSIRKRLW